MGIDIGGTKTLVASLNDEGVIKEKIRFETPHNYEAFLTEAAQALHSLKAHDFHAGGIGAPGKIDRHHGRAWAFGNLPWSLVPLAHDLEKLTHCPMVLENDAKMAALSEAMMVKHEYDRVLYVTISTGIGYGLVVERKLDTSISDHGGSVLLAEHHGRHVPWESFASGRAIVERFGKKACDINDARTWHIITRDIAKGLRELIAVTEPDVVVIGGSVGVYFEKYGAILQKELERYKNPLLAIPDLRPAARPEEAVLFGCYDLAKEHFHASVA